MKTERPMLLAAFLVAAPLAGCGKSTSPGAGDAGLHDGSADSASRDLSSPPDASSATCALTPVCTAGHACISLQDNSGLTQFALRMSEVDFTAPVAFQSGGVIGQVLSNSAALNLPACNLGGTGTFSWLLRFDTAAQTLTLGGAPTPADPTAGYSFASGTSSGFPVTPVAFGLTLGNGGAFSTAAAQNVNLIAYLDAADTMSVVMPLRQVAITGGQLSANNTCIGSYNAAGLSPQTGCMPDSTHQQFLTAAQLGGFINLADADKVTLSSLQESLCLLLAGGTLTNYDDGTGHCKRDGNGNVLFQGDWCTATNAAATAGCADAVQLKASFAASGVKING